MGLQEDLQLTANIYLIINKIEKFRGEKEKRSKNKFDRVNYWLLEINLSGSLKLRDSESVSLLMIYLVFELIY